MNTHDLKAAAREPSTILGLGFIALALQEFQNGITAVACIKFLAGACGVFLREHATASQMEEGTHSTSVEVSASLKKEVSKNGKT